MTTEQKFAVILPAAGSGKRFGQGDKLLADLAGQTVLQRSVAAFAHRQDVAAILIATAPDRFDPYRQHLAPVLGRANLLLVQGGRERWESVLLALRAVPADINFVAIHDAARPLVPAAVIDAAFAGAVATGGSVPVVAEPATLKRLDAGRQVTETVPRAGLFQAQTPQCFHRAALLAANEKLLAAGQIADVTDDAQIFERSGRPVAGTAGSALNLKITTAEDLDLARAILAAGAG